MAKKLPSSFSEYFWDVDFKSIDPNKSSSFVIKRVLDRGNTAAIKWLLRNYPKEKIERTVLTTRDLSQKTANFWADVFKLDKTKVVCLQKPYSRIQFGLSS